jgi:hypothetical protein
MKTADLVAIVHKKYHQTSSMELWRFGQKALEEWWCRELVVVVVVAIIDIIGTATASGDDSCWVERETLPSTECCSPVVVDTAAAAAIARTLAAVSTSRIVHILSWHDVVAVRTNSSC